MQVEYLPIIISAAQQPMVTAGGKTFLGKVVSYSGC